VIVGLDMRELHVKLMLMNAKEQQLTLEEDLIHVPMVVHVWTRLVDMSARVQQDGQDPNVNSILMNVQVISDWQNVYMGEHAIRVLPLDQCLNVTVCLDGQELSVRPILMSVTLSLLLVNTRGSACKHIHLGPQMLASFACVQEQVTLAIVVRTM
jgi:hypothetical protein